MMRVSVTPGPPIKITNWETELSSVPSTMGTAGSVPTCNVSDTSAGVAKASAPRIDDPPNATAIAKPNLARLFVIRMTASPKGCEPYRQCPIDKLNQGIRTWERTYGVFGIWPTGYAYRAGPGGSCSSAPW